MRTAHEPNLVPAASSQAEGSGTAGVGQVMQLLNLFITNNGWRGVRAIARESGISKSAVQRLASSLAAGGFLERDSETGQYRLGPLVGSLGTSAHSSFEHELVNRSALNQLVRTVGETAYVAVLDGLFSVPVARVESTRAVRAVSELGQRMPAWSVASGKVMLAGLPMSELKTALPASFESRATSSLRSRAELLADLEGVRTNGYSVVTSEFEQGMKSVAAPITARDGQTIAAVSVVGPADRLGGDQMPALIAEVVRAARRSSERSANAGTSP